MSFMNINTKRDSERGFTIVELLIVIVVIAILAAITIVSYNGITSRANASSAASNVETVLKIAEAYNSDGSKYPATKANFTSGYTDSTITTAAVKLPAGITVVSGTVTANSALAALASPTAALLSASNGTTNVAVYFTGTSAAPTGGVIISWDYGTGAPQLAAKYTYYGAATASSTYNTLP